jgi:hypothetical protein
VSSAGETTKDPQLERALDVIRIARVVEHRAP